GSAGVSPAKVVHQVLSAKCRTPNARNIIILSGDVISLCEMTTLSKDPHFVLMTHHYSHSDVRREKQIPRRSTPRNDNGFKYVGRQKAPASRRTSSLLTTDH